MSATKASRLRVSTLKRVDLPTFGRPTSATTGSMMRASSRRSVRGQTISADTALGVFHVDGIADDQRLGANRLLRQPFACRQRAIAGLQPVHVAFHVTDHDVIPLYGGAGQPTVFQRVVLPHVGAAALVERPDPGLIVDAVEDRKSTRLNSSHPSISY